MNRLLINSTLAAITAASGYGTYEAVNTLFHTDTPISDSASVGQATYEGVGSGTEAFPLLVASALGSTAVLCGGVYLANETAVGLGLKRRRSPTDW